MGVICWYYDVSELDAEELFDRAMAQLPWEARRQKVLRYLHRKDQLLCLGAGVLAQKMLLQAGATDLELDFGPSGKPFLKKHPQLHFNLSHSGSLAVCAVGDVPLGVDVECIAPVDAAVAAYCLSGEEQAHLRNADDPQRCFCSLWTRKESCLKMLGRGLDTPLSQWSVLPGCPWHFAGLELPDALISVCTQENTHVEFKRFCYGEEIGNER